MTQPNEYNWINELLERYNRDELNFSRQKAKRKPRRDRRTPVGFDFERPAFDPSSFYRQYGSLRDISRAGTRVREEKDRNRFRQLQQSIIDPSQTAQRRQRPASSSSSSLALPLQNYSITSEYGRRNPPTSGATSMHTGIDLAAPTGTPVYATHSGTATRAGWNSGYGYQIILDNGNGIQTMYGHQNGLAIEPGQYIERGQLIGYVGSTGVSTGPHLHYEVIVNGQKVNPRHHM